MKYINDLLGDIYISHTMDKWEHLGNNEPTDL